MQHYISETRLIEAIPTEILPFLDARRTTFSVRPDGETTLQVTLLSADQPRGTLFFLHGFAECTEKYREFLYYALKNNLSVLAYDQRGHGCSTRKAPFGVIHAEAFEDYPSDFSTVFDAVCASLPRPFYLLGHSMGGAVAALVLERYQNTFSKAVLSAPMLDLFLTGLPRALGHTATVLSTLLGQGMRPVHIKGKKPKGERFATSAYLSPARYRAIQQMREENEQLTGGSPSAAWCRCAFGAKKAIFRPGAVEQIDAEVLLLSAEREHLVSNRAHEQFVARLPRGKQLLLSSAKHELLFSNDELLFPLLDTVFAFLK